MSALARWCARHRFIVVGTWVAGIVVLMGLAGSLGSGFKTVGDLPDSDSARAYSLLGTTQADSDKTETGRILWRTIGTGITNPEVKSDVTTMLANVEKLPGVISVESPYAAAGTDAAGGDVSTSHNTAYANVTVSTDDVDVDQVLDTAQSVNNVELTVVTGGQAFAPKTTAGGAAEMIGIVAALIILVLLFRSAWAAAMPIVTGVVGVMASLLFVMVISHVLTLASESITMGSLIGLGVGIDYALFIVNRHRKALTSGATVNEGIEEAVNTSGRAVIFAGLTVIAALLAMFIVGMTVLTGMGQAAAITVGFTVVAAITLLPALLSLLGHRVLSKKQRAALAAGNLEPALGDRTSRWAQLVTRRPIPIALAALVALGALTLPALSLRVGEADSSTDPAGTVSRTYFDTTTAAFGAGIDAPLLLVAKAPDAPAQDALDDLVTQLRDTDNVASVTEPTQESDGVFVIQLTPGTSSGDEETEGLVHHLRDSVIPHASNNVGLNVYVGGTTATNIDMASHLMGNLSIYLSLVAILGFLLLVLAFRSLLLPLLGALSNLATILVGLGVITAVFQWGWGTDLLGVGDGGPISYIVPVTLMGVIFGLSMDYQVFLISRMHEEWTKTHDHVRSIQAGLSDTTRVIVTAASIMFCVFASFGFSGQRIVACIGVGMALAVVVDAFLVRLVLMPALMKLIGPRVWAFPRWAERITPRVSIEGAAEPVSGTLVAATATEEF